jgi:hypothetical protein
VLALLAGGCTKEEAPTVAASPTVTPTESPTPPPPPPIAPLTGIELDEPVDRAVLAVKIDNASAALPPDGIEDADIVFEEEVEGGLTRFLVLFHSQDPEEVGPVRSGREADADLLPQFQAVLGFSGADNSVKSMLRDAGVEFYEEGEADGAFYRVDDRIAPHNLFAHTKDLWAQGESLPVPEEPVLAFDESAPDGGKDVGALTMTFSSFITADWTYDDAKNNWLREQNGSEHATADGRTVSADNVVVMRVQSRQGNRTDSAGNPTVELDVIGKGKMQLFRDGRVYKGRWSKETAEKPLEFTWKGGEPLPLRPGQTWIEILPVGDPLKTSKAKAQD